MRLRYVGLGVVAVTLLFTFACIAGLVLFGASRSFSAPGDHVAIVPITGVISSGDSGGVFATGGADSTWLVRKLDDLADDDSVKVVLLKIDSPGGGVTASDEIYRAIKRVQASGKPVVSWFGTTAASGGYYVAAPSDQIVSMPNTITGSIGVIAQVPDLTELYEKIGVDMQVVKSGEFKDMMSPSRPLTGEEEAILRSIILESYDEFVRIIAEGRDMPEERVRELADGRIYSGQQAFELGLVDELGDFPHAISVAGEFGDLGTDPDTVTYSKDAGLFGVLFQRVATAIGIELPDGLGIPSTHLSLRY